MRRLPAAATLLCCAGLAACGAPGDDTPAACLQGAGAYMRALTRAPTAVRLGGGTPISDCLVKNQTPGDLATVGTALISAATRLNAKARSDPEGKAALRLGYLLGAARRGAADTGGIHSVLLRRLEAAARYAPGGRSLRPALVRRYRRGLEAGFTGG